MNETMNKIEELIATAEKFRSSYLWQAPTSASCSTQNVYAKGEYYRDGKKTTLTAIRNSLRRMRGAV